MRSAVYVCRECGRFVCPNCQSGPHVQGIVKAAQLLVRVQREERELSPVADSRRDGRVGWSEFGNPWLSDGRLVDWVI